MAQRGKRSTPPKGRRPSPAKQAREVAKAAGEGRDPVADALGGISGALVRLSQCVALHDGAPLAQQVDRLTASLETTDIATEAGATLADTVVMVAHSVERAADAFERIAFALEALANVPHKPTAFEEADAMGVQVKLTAEGIPPQPDILREQAGTPGQPERTPTGAQVTVREDPGHLQIDVEDTVQVPVPTQDSGNAASG